MSRCSRCGKVLKVVPTVINGKPYGPVCARLITRIIPSWWKWFK